MQPEGTVMKSRRYLVNCVTAAVWMALPILSTAQIAAEEVRLDLEPSGIDSYLQAYRPMQLELDLEKPAGIKKLPAGLVAPRYGKLKLGPRERPSRYYVVLDAPQGEDARLFVDANGNGDFRDDPPAEWQRSLAGTKYVGGATLIVYYDTEALPLHVNMNYLLDGDKSIFGYYRDYARVGRVTLGDTSYGAVLSDDLVCGDFRDSGVAAAPALLILDLNGDGKFHPRHEGFPVNKPFNVGGITYEIKDMTASGSSFQLVKSSQTVSETKPR